MYIPLLVQPAQVTAVIYKVKIVAAAASVCHTVLVDSKGKYSPYSHYEYFCGSIALIVCDNINLICM